MLASSTSLNDWGNLNGALLFLWLQVGYGISNRRIRSTSSVVVLHVQGLQYNACQWLTSSSVSSTPFPPSPLYGPQMSTLYAFLYSLTRITGPLHRLHKKSAMVHTVSFSHGYANGLHSWRGERMYLFRDFCDLVGRGWFAVLSTSPARHPHRTMPPFPDSSQRVTA